MPGVQTSAKDAAGAAPQTVVGLLGGSFNPAHAGHLEISHAALKHLSLSAVWWLVSPGNPLKDPALYAPYQERFEGAARIVDDPRIIISDFENDHGLQYTSDTIAALQDAHPTIKFIWLMGADSLQSFHLWKNWRGIADRVAIAVFNRPGAENAPIEAPAVKELSPHKVEFTDTAAMLERTPPVWTFIPLTNNSISSTELRAARDKTVSDKNASDNNSRN
ncbi:MAG: nicotinate (nicotinamide) nucleotide adenylyltransferase [Pseudomonadota bacterium]